MTIIGDMDTDRPDWMRAINGRMLHLWIHTGPLGARSSQGNETLCGAKNMVATRRAGRLGITRCAKCEAELEKAKGGGK